MTITISLWIIPLVVTIGYFIYYMYIFDDGFCGVLGYMMIGFPTSLVSWLVWALFFK